MSRLEQHALLAFINAFKPTKKVTAFEQLADGKALMEMMNQIDGIHFKSTPVRGVTTPTASSSENWVLKMNTLKRLYRLLLSYPLPAPHPENLGLTSLREPSFNSIARTPTSSESTKGLAQICRLCLAVGVWGPGNEGVIRRIQALPEGDMAELMRCIEDVMATFPEDVRNASKQASPEKPGLRQSPPSPPISGLREERDRLLQENDELRMKCEKITLELAEITSRQDHNETDKDAVGMTVRNDMETGPGPGLRTSQTATTEVDRLRSDLGKSEDNLSKMEADLETQRRLVRDLTKTVDDLRVKASEASKMKDQLDEYRHAAERLQKSENVVEKYKKKLEDSAGLRRELRSLEEENSMLVNTNATLEAELRNIEKARNNSEGNKNRITELEERISIQISEIAELQHQLEDAQTLVIETSRLHERDLAELQQYQEASKELGVGGSSLMQRDQSRMSIIGGKTTLGDELALDTGDVETKTDLKLRIRALQRELALVRVGIPQSPDKGKGDNLLDGTGRESEVDNVIGRDVSDQELIGQVTQLKVRLSIARDEITKHTQEINRLLLEKIDLQSAGIDQREQAIEREKQLGDLRLAMASNNVPKEAQQQIEEIHHHNAVLREKVKALEVELLSDKEGADLTGDFGEAQRSYEAQIETLQTELQIAKSDRQAADKRYKLEQQLMLSAWHELGSRTVREHISATGNVRRGPRPVATSWLGRQRKHQEDAAFANLRQLVEGLAKQVHVTGGVVREIKNLGIGLTLPNRCRRHQQYHYRGDHFTMLFDTSPLVLNQLNEQLRGDTLVIKWTFLKKGAKLSQLMPKSHPTIEFSEPSPPIRDPSYY